MLREAAASESHQAERVARGSSFVLSLFLSSYSPAGLVIYFNFIFFFREKSGLFSSLFC